MHGFICLYDICICMYTVGIVWIGMFSVTQSRDNMSLLKNQVFTLYRHNAAKTCFFGKILYTKTERYFLKTIGLNEYIY